MLSVRVLGVLAVEQDGRPVEIPHGRPLQLIAYLALHPGPHPRRRVAELLWADCDPERARQRLRTALWEVRGASNGNQALVVATRAAVGLHEAAGVDLWHARELLDAGATEAVLALLAPGVDEELDQQWAAQARRDADTWRLEALQAAAREAPNPSSALIHARRRVALDPLSEEAHRELICLLADSGDRAAAMSVYERMRALLESELGIGPSTVSRDLLRQLSSGDTSLVTHRADEGRTRRRVPVATTPIIGRDSDLLDLDESLRSGRLVTVVGSGGVGKSRVAYALAEQEEARGRRVTVAELATTGRGESCDYVVAASLGVHAGPGRAVRDAIVDRLELEPGLLVLDNCEHVLPAVRDLVAHVLRWSAATKVLATSREPLALPGECLVHVRPLPVPADGADEAAVLASPAVQLLTAAARRGSSQTAPQVHRAAELARLARRLDGLPLALELAGARIGSLGVPVLTDRLASGLDVLSGGGAGSGGRQDSLLATLQWSMTMLTPNERTLLGLLSVPPGPLPMSAVQAMVLATGMTTDPVVGVARLVEASLIQVHRDDVWCYSALETIRVFGASLLPEGTAATARQGLVGWAVCFAEDLRRRGFTDEQRVHAEAVRFLPLVRAALQEARDRGDGPAQRRIITGIEGWSTWREQPEVWAWVMELAAREAEEKADAEILRMGALAAFRLGRKQEMAAFTQRCVAADPDGASGASAAAALMMLALAERRWSQVTELAGRVCAVGQDPDRAVAMTVVAEALAKLGKPREARVAARSAREYAERIGAPSLRALALITDARACASAEPMSGDGPPDAMLAEARLLAHSVGSAELVAAADKEQGLQALGRGLPESAVGPLRESSLYWLGTGNTGPLRKAIDGLAESLDRTGRGALAVRLLRLARHGKLTVSHVASLVP